MACEPHLINMLLLMRFILHSRLVTASKSLTNSTTKLHKVDHFATSERHGIARLGHTGQVRACKSWKSPQNPNHVLMLENKGIGC